MGDANLCLQSDPYELHNLYTTAHDAPFHFSTTFGGAAGDIATESFPGTSGSTTHTSNNNSSSQPPSSIKHILARLDSLLVVLKTCKGRQCTHPWEVLHPKGDVRDLHAALNTEYDDFYLLEQERVYFSKCEKGYIAESEGPDGVKAWTVEDVGARGGSRWQDLV